MSSSLRHLSADVRGVPLREAYRPLTQKEKANPRGNEGFAVTQLHRFSQDEHCTGRRKESTGTRNSCALTFVLRKTFPSKRFCIFRAARCRRPRDVPSPEQGWHICLNCTTRVKGLWWRDTGFAGSEFPVGPAISNVCKAEGTDYFVSNFPLCGVPLVYREAGSLWSAEVYYLWGVNWGIGIFRWVSIKDLFVCKCSVPELDFGPSKCTAEWSSHVY